MGRWNGPPVQCPMLACIVVSWRAACCKGACGPDVAYAETPLSNRGGLQRGVTLRGAVRGVVQESARGMLWQGCRCSKQLGCVRRSAPIPVVVVCMVLVSQQHTAAGNGQMEGGGCCFRMFYFCATVLIPQATTTYIYEWWWGPRVCIPYTLSPFQVTHPGSRSMSRTLWCGGDACPGKSVPRGRPPRPGPPDTRPTEIGLRRGKPELKRQEGIYI